MEKYIAKDVKDHHDIYDIFYVGKGDEIKSISKSIERNHRRGKYSHSILCTVSSSIYFDKDRIYILEFTNRYNNTPFIRLVETSYFYSLIQKQRIVKVSL